MVLKMYTCEINFIVKSFNHITWLWCVMLKILIIYNLFLVLHKVQKLEDEVIKTRDH